MPKNFSKHDLPRQMNIILNAFSASIRFIQKHITYSLLYPFLLEKCFIQHTQFLSLWCLVAGGSFVSYVLSLFSLNVLFLSLWGISCYLWPGFVVWAALTPVSISTLFCMHFINTGILYQCKLIISYDNIRL